MAKVKISELTQLPVDKRVNDTFIIPATFNDNGILKTSKITAKDLKDYVDTEASKKYSLSIGDKNSFTINNTTYILSIEKNKLFIKQYAPTSYDINFGQTNSNTINPTYNEIEFDSSYGPFESILYPYTSITCVLENNVVPIVITGVVYSDDNENKTSSYIYGENVTISNGLILDKEYSNKCECSLNLESVNNIPETRTQNGGTVTTSFNVYEELFEQNITVYLHEQGKSSLTKIDFTDISSISTTIPTPYKSYFLWYSASEEFDELNDIYKNGKTNKPKNIYLESPANQYAFFAISENNKKFYMNGFAGGVKYLGETTYYSDNTKYYVYRTENTGITGDLQIN